MSQEHVFSALVGDKEITIKTGKLAQQAGGAITIQMGDTVVFCSATMGKRPREGVDFLPLSVDFEERLYAAGRIPGGFLRREGRPSDHAVLISRLCDRPLRPLFNKTLRHEIQVILMSLAHDQVNDVDMLSIIAASTAVHISDIPWAGPIGAARIGLIDGELRVNPTIPEMEDSILDLRVAGSEDAIIMVECNATEVPEETMIEALELAHSSIQDIIQLQHEMRAAIGKEKRVFAEEEADDTFQNSVLAKINDDITNIVATKIDRDDRRVALEDLNERMISDFADDDAEDELLESAKEIKSTIDKAIRQEIRRRTVAEGIRSDGRELNQLRNLSAEVAQLPRVHGSGLFQRGETQVLSICTLGTPADSQMLDGLHPEDNKRYMHHYNFPPYSTGETWFMRGPKRREIGHGILGENAILTMIPDEEEFPYTVRVVSEVMSSNGSTSMASVCASTLALMDAGVPIRKPVAGIAMGLIKEGDEYAVLTDIQGLEDHIGDMDFKVAGTSDGINALQMDIKIKGVPRDVMTRALMQAKDARLQILEVMEDTIAEPRADMSEYAPRILIIEIDPEKIGAIIGPGGKNIRSIQDSTNTKIEIKEDGKVFISSVDGVGAQRAIDRIKGIVEDPELGQVYAGKITRVENYGTFVEFLPGNEGLVHISQLADYKIERIHDEFSIGDEIMVMVTDVDSSGKVRLSRQAVIEGWSLEEARQKDKGGRSGGGGNRGRGGDRRGGGGNRGRGGGDRR